ncbi:MAG TPA: hypothetical protein VJ576_07515 [Rhodocyclaceae bacterium]|nr:hypothetical protein [Rhodocyclaceae bacterium]
MSNRVLWLVLLLAICCGCSNMTSEAEIGPPVYGQCVSGDCQNGFGTRRFPSGVEIAGRWVSGEQVAGAYEVRHPCQPDRTHRTVIDSSRHPVEGTVIRSCARDSLQLSQPGRISSFTGTFSTIYNPFTREQVSTYKSGKFTDSNGIVWEGEFDYIPIRHSIDLPGYGRTFFRSGVFVFIGARIDSQLDEVRRGLFISQPVRPEEGILFTRARPDYLDTIRATFVAESAQHSVDLAAETRARQELFNNIAAIATGAVVIYGASKVAASSNRGTLDSLSNVLTGKTTPEKAASELGQVRPSNNAVAQRPMTVAEYRGQQSNQSAQNRNKTVATADKRQEPGVMNRQPATVKRTKEERGSQERANVLQPQPKPSATVLLTGGGANENDSWKTCGPDKWCDAGDGYLQFCRGAPTGKRCKSECIMSSGVIYHDTELSKNVAYIPSNERCAYPCDVRNSCS